MSAVCRMALSALSGTADKDVVQGNMNELDEISDGAHHLLSLH